MPPPGSDARGGPPPRYTTARRQKIQTANVVLIEQSYSGRLERLIAAKLSNDAARQACHTVTRVAVSYFSIQSQSDFGSKGRSVTIGKILRFKVSEMSLFCSRSSSPEMLLADDDSKIVKLLQLLEHRSIECNKTLQFLFSTMRMLILYCCGRNDYLEEELFHIQSNAHRQLY